MKQKKEAFGGIYILWKQRETIIEITMEVMMLSEQKINKSTITISYVFIKELKLIKMLEETI